MSSKWKGEERLLLFLLSDGEWCVICKKLGKEKTLSILP